MIFALLMIGLVLAFEMLLPVITNPEYPYYNEKLSFSWKR
ncbi:unnamed protein product [Enterobius vermicularis]|uniref:DUF2065 domain-containing protein n=1 Tax=Enterobius vermicularis TaxID=51028 RepID=A0A0N4UYP9_ENTVE|nr:unnamed protein product [Enterobius vermicularis]